MHLYECTLIVHIDANIHNTLLNRLHRRTFYIQIYVQNVQRLTFVS